MLGRNHNKADTSLLIKVIVILENYCYGLTYTKIKQQIGRAEGLKDGLAFLAWAGIIEKIRTNSKQLVCYQLTEDYKNRINLTNKELEVFV